MTGPGQQGQAVRAGVIGWPVAHSRSPLIFGHWFKTHGLAGEYRALAVPPTELAAFLRDLPGAGLAGVNVTLPHKEAVCAFLARHGRLDATARTLGAVNLVICRAGGLEGRNTDVQGFLDNLRAQMRRQSCGLRLRGCRALVLGAGGAARAVVAALAGAAADICVANRTPARAAALLEALQVRGRALALADAPDLLEHVDLLVNATSVGMAGGGMKGGGMKGGGMEDMAGGGMEDMEGGGMEDMEGGAADLAPWCQGLTMMPAHAVVSDLVYAPPDTALLRAAAARGLACVDGVGMLICQAAPAFEAWCGVRPQAGAVLRAKVAASLAAAGRRP